MRMVSRVNLLFGSLLGAMSLLTLFLIVLTPGLLAAMLALIPLAPLLAAPLITEVILVVIFALGAISGISLILLGRRLLIVWLGQAGVLYAAAYLAFIVWVLLGTSVPAYYFPPFTPLPSLLLVFLLVVGYTSVLGPLLFSWVAFIFFAVGIRRLKRNTGEPDLSSALAFALIGMLTTSFFFALALVLFGVSMGKVAGSKKEWHKA